MQHIASMISSPRRQTAINAQERLNALERISIERIDRLISGSIKAISVMNNITRSDVSGILEKIHVATIGEVQKAVENLDGMEGVNVIRLTVGIEETLKAIAGATNLDVAEITEIFAMENGALAGDIASRLHAKSKAVGPSQA